MARCGRNTRQGVVRAFGMGVNRNGAVQVATQLAQTIALGEGTRWVNAQKCPKGCPFRSEVVRMWGPARVRFAVPMFDGIWGALVSQTWQANLWCKESPEEVGAGEGGD